MKKKGKGDGGKEGKLSGRVGRGTDKITRMRQEERMREKRVQEQENLKEVMKVEEDRDTVGGNEARMNRERGRW